MVWRSGMVAGGGWAIRWCYFRARRLAPPRERTHPIFVAQFKAATTANPQFEMSTIQSSQPEQLGSSVAGKTAAAASQQQPHGGPAQLQQHVSSLLQELRSANSPEQAEASLALLQRVLGNVIAHPQEDKYRHVRKTVAAVQNNIINVPTALGILRAFGFEDDPADSEHLIVPASQPGHAAVCKQVEHELLVVQAAKDPNKASMLAAIQKREAARLEAQKEKERILQQVGKVSALTGRCPWTVSVSPPTACDDTVR